jgi:acetylornithine deacetylase
MSVAKLSSKELLKRLVSFDTTSSRSNLSLLEFVCDYLRGYGVQSQLIHDKTGLKANLYAFVGGDPKAAGLVLSGHTDIVPADASAWSFEPFHVIEAAGRLYGRGTADMKGFLASSLALVPEILDSDLRTPIILAFSYDEEVGCLGVPSLIKALTELPTVPFLCVVGEPTSMQPVLAHKGKVALRCHVFGVEAHSAMTHVGANAIEAAAKIITFIAAMADDLRLRGNREEGFMPPYTTLQTSKIGGGTAGNIVPDYCSFDFEIRSIPADDAAALIDVIKQYVDKEIAPGLHARAPSARIEWEELFAYPGLSTDENCSAGQWILNITGANTIRKVSYGTEAGLFHKAGIPTVICGPGSIEQAHKRDEYLEVDQLASCDAFLRRVIGDLAKRVEAK